MPANYVLLGQQTLSTAVASVTFSNIPQTGYTDLKLVASMRVTDGGEGSAPPISRCELTFNGTGTNYTIKMLYGIPGASPSVNSAGGTGATRDFYNGAATSSNATANTYSSAEYYIPNYSSSTISKSFGIKNNIENGGLSSEMDITAGIWNSTAAITSIKINPYNSGNFSAYTTFSLYGIAAVGVTPVIAPKATGGNIVVNDGTYWYHAFLSSGTFTPAQALSCDVLTIAGGGGGGGGAFDRGYGGGGGAGGVVYSSSQTFTATSYSATVGAGGVGGLGLGNPGSNGSNSSITGGALSLTASVGGGGGGAFSVPATAYSGGSGGGGGNNGGTAGSGTSGQGFAGGSGQAYTTGGYGNGLPGGGGGAGEAGNTDGQGYGGDGISTYSSWASATSTGVSGYYAGGGASGPGAAGGLGGGADGVGNVSSNGNNGTANTGGGASNAGGQNPASTGGTGGSGIVIVRYTIA